MHQMTVDIHGEFSSATDRLNTLRMGHRILQPQTALEGSNDAHTFSFLVNNSNYIELNTY